jgi:hypothetical protein
MCSEIPSVNQRRHAHRDDEPRRASGEQPSWDTALSIFERNTGTHDLFDERFEESGHRSVPERKKDCEMLRRNDGLLRFNEALWQMTVRKILLSAQHREVEARYLNPHYIMSAGRGTFCIGISECITEAITARIGMTLDNYDPSRHSPVSLRNSLRSMGIAQTGRERFDRDQSEAA